MIRHLHSSGRFDRKEQQLRSALYAYAQRGVDVLTLTEQANGLHRRVLHSWAADRDYDVVQGNGPGDDAAIAVRRSTARIVKVWAGAATSHEQRRGPGGPPPAHYLTALVHELATGKQLIVSVLHTPSHVEQDWRLGARAWRVFVWLDAQRGWKKHLREVRRNRRRAKVLLVADWNLDLKKSRFRAVLRSLYPHLSLTWWRFDGPGTHGPRTIDGSLTNATVIAPAHVITDDDSSDHRPYAELLEL